MINPKILELVRSRENFQPEDLKIFEEEIEKFPYAQNLRALHLFGTHQFTPENYQTALSKTAAYTTDKKNLYTFINGDKPKNIAQKSDLKEKAFDSETVINKVVAQPEIYNKITTSEIDAPKQVFVNGELNRILFEGEEDFLTKENSKIDIEATVESGTLVLEKVAEENKSADFQVEEIKLDENQNAENAEGSLEIKSLAEIQKPEETDFSETAEFTTETIIDEDSIEEEKPIIEDASLLSFHAGEEFLPEVKLRVSTESSKKEIYQPKPQISRHEEEMRKLIAEVEAKMKVSKREKEPEAEVHTNKDVNFSNTQSFEILEDSNSLVSEIIKEIPSEIPQVEKPAEKTESSWTPMNFTPNTPDSLLAKENIPAVKRDKPAIVEVPTEVLSEESKQENQREINMSFFSPTVSQIEIKKQIIPQKEEISNVPTFINTWQNWLKIDKKTEKTPQISEEESKIKVKEKAIETFIESQPKISKLREDLNFEVKEKTEDISHLMTETLAKLYIEQKLYGKAIKAYEILSAKFPDRKGEFAEKIKKIKDLRLNK